MSLSNSTRRRRERRQQQPTSESIDLEVLQSSTAGNNATTISIPPVEQEAEQINNESPLIKIIQRKRRKDWAKLVAPVDEERIKKKKESITTKLTKGFSKIPTPFRALLNFIEHRNGYTIRSYFEFIVWLFYLNLFTFILCFTCIIMPTYIYPNSIDFSTYAMNEYNHRNNLSSNQSIDQCNLNDPQCQILDIPLSLQTNDSDSTCLNDSYTASSCCSLHTDTFFLNSSYEAENNWGKFLIDLTDGTGYFTLTRLFIGYYRNLTKSDHENSYIQTYNMGLAVFLTILACFLITGIIIVRKYGDSMKRSYVQNESFENHLFQYIFARWNYRTTNLTRLHRHEQRFRAEIKNILFERNDKRNFKFERSRDKILFQLSRLIVWLITLVIFIGAITALYFANRFTFQERAKKEINGGTTGSNRFRDMVIEYLPSIVISVINLISQLIFDFMRSFKLYAHTAALRHYLIKVTLMRLLLLFTFVFIIILQITCNSNQCGRQSELIDCAEIKGRATFIHCWETLIGQAIYRLVLTDTAVMILVHIIVDPLRSWMNWCYHRRTKEEEEDGTINSSATASKTCFLFLPLEFEVGDYVLDLTYTQALCWHGLLFCPFLPLISAVKNLLIFGIKMLSLVSFRRRTGLELSPVRAQYMFTGVLLFSFVWALLPIAFLTTSLRTSRGCSPFRLYSHEPDSYIYYPIRNLFLQIQNETLVNILFKITSAIVVIPVVLVLILLLCFFTMRRNSYRGASIELYKLLYSSHKTHQLAVRKAPVITTTL